MEFSEEDEGSGRCKEEGTGGKEWVSTVKMEGRRNEVGRKML
jgi:hypothetical protein